MRLCIFGVGAVGGLLAAHLAAGGADVRLVARGPQLAAIRASGLRLIKPDGETLHVHPPATDDARDLGRQDAVFLCVKAHAQPAAADAMEPLLGPRTRVVFVQNGIPWWYFHALDGPWRDHTLENLDPGGRLLNVIGPGRAMGCLTYVAADVAEPGVIRHTGDRRFILGEPGGSRSEDCLALAAELERSGLEASVSERIRDAVWLKLWGNLALNPISTLTGATMDQMCADPDIRTLIKAMMAEARVVGEALGARFEGDMDARLANAEGLVGFKPSMRQDLEQGRPLEIDAIVGAVSEMGRLAGVATPQIDAVLALVRQRARAGSV
ncbi:MAG: 2-dehydropantoate 2-reductase [Rhodospirillales bacterium]|jgi:2-dehydropantoate 2-reductase|nr:2-dehydropantoate 2-reductase [Rhodospirillales bacterium]